MLRVARRTLHLLLMLSYVRHNKVGVGKNWGSGLKTGTQVDFAAAVQVVAPATAKKTGGERSRLLLQHLHKLGLRAGGANLLM